MMMYPAVLFDLDNTLCDMVAAKAMMATSVSPDAQAQVRRYSEQLSEFVQPNPVAIALVTLLARHRSIGIVSNGSASAQAKKLFRTLNGFIPWPVVISGREGCRKPDVHIFTAALEKLDLAPDKVLFVGDDPWEDMYGAARAGLATCWLSHGREQSELPCRVDYVIEKLDDLLELLS